MTHTTPLFLLLFVLMTNGLCAQAPAEMVDSRDNHRYTTVTVNQQQWIAQSLYWDCPESYCCYDSAEFCAPYGKLYSWKAAQTACPAGYRLPSPKDFEQLVPLFKGETAFAQAAKQGWKIQPAGHKTSFGVYYNFGFYAHFWTSEGQALSATAFEINFLSHRTYFSKFGRDVSLSVICLKN